MNDVIYDAEGAHEGRYECTQRLMWVHVRANIGSREWAVMGLESLVVSAQVTKLLLLFLVKQESLVRTKVINFMYWLIYV